MHEVFEGVVYHYGKVIIQEKFAAGTCVMPISVTKQARIMLVKYLLFTFSESCLSSF